MPGTLAYSADGKQLAVSLRAVDLHRGRRESGFHRKIDNKFQRRVVVFNLKTVVSKRKIIITI